MAGVCHGWAGKIPSDMTRSRRSGSAGNREFQPNGGNLFHLAGFTNRWFGAWHGLELLSPNCAPPGRSSVRTEDERIDLNDALQHCLDVIGRHEYREVEYARLRYPSFPPFRELPISQISSRHGRLPLYMICSAKRWAKRPPVRMFISVALRPIGARGPVDRVQKPASSNISR